MKITINTKLEIARLEKEKAQLIDRFMLKCEAYNSQIKYLKQQEEILKKKGE